MSSLRAQFRSSLRYGLCEQLVVRACDLFIMVIVLRSLSIDETALFGVITGSIVFFNLVGLVPETVILRSYREWEKNADVDRHLEALFSFAVVRSLLLPLGAGIVAALSGMSFKPASCLSLYVAAVQLNQLAELTRLVYRVRLEQNTILRVDGCLRAALFAALALLLWLPGLLTYLSLYALWSAVSSFYWARRLRELHTVRLRPHVQHLVVLRDVVSEYSLWAHLCGVVTFGIYNIDPWCMAIVGVVSEDVGNYTVALKVSSLFFVFPMFVQSMTMLLTTNLESDSRRVEALGAVLVLNALFAAVQFVSFVLAGELLLAAFSKSVDIGIAYQFGLVINLGVLAVNLARPLVGYLNASVSLRRLFLSVYLPSATAAVILYFALTSVWGAWGTAWASAVVYMVLAASLWIFFASSTDWRRMLRANLREFLALARG